LASAAYPSSIGLSPEDQQLVAAGASESADATAHL
jgi:hypothetical protein